MLGLARASQIPTYVNPGVDESPPAAHRPPCDDVGWDVIPTFGPPLNGWLLFVCGCRVNSPNRRSSVV
jgi:hypothetical protein